jgi:hydroxyacylglutathione hydrolase
MNTRREFLEHAGALGLGAVFLPATAMVRRAGAAEGVVDAKRVPGLIFETIESGGIAAYSYFIGDTRTGGAAVIDPRRDVDVYVELAAKHKLKITHAIETHIHADFVSGSRELAARTGAGIFVSAEGGAKYGFSIQPVHDGDELKVGGLVLKAIHTPGHTPEHMAYLASLQGKADGAWALFTGDFLFAGSVGRPDLMGVANTGKLAGELFESLQTAFKDLPDAVPIYPAHGPGSPCGAGIVARKGIPTLGTERHSNPALQFGDETAFIDDLLFRQPPVPYYWPRMKRINAQGPKILGELPVPKALKPKEFAALIADEALQLVDTRQMLGFGGGHIPGALNLGYSSSISMWGGWLLDPDRPIALVLPPDGKVEEVVAWLARVCITDFAAVLDGGMKAWLTAGNGFETIKQMSIQELNQRMKSPDDLVILDVRQPMEWDHGHLRNSRYLFLPEIPRRMKELDRARPLAMFCGTGYRASIAASLLKRAGFDVSNVPGAFTAWLAAGYDVEVPQSAGKASDTRRRA